MNLIDLDTVFSGQTLIFFCSSSPFTIATCFYVCCILLFCSLYFIYICFRMQNIIFEFTFSKVFSKSTKVKKMSNFLLLPLCPPFLLIQLTVLHHFFESSFKFCSTLLLFSFACYVRIIVP